MRDCGALQAARDKAGEQADLALAALADFPDNAHTQTLRALTQSLRHRTA